MTDDKAAPVALSPEVVAVLDDAWREWVAAGRPAGEGVVHLAQFLDLGWSEPTATAD